MFGRNFSQFKELDEISRIPAAARIGRRSSERRTDIFALEIERLRTNQLVVIDLPQRLKVSRIKNLIIPIVRHKS